VSAPGCGAASFEQNFGFVLVGGEHVDGRFDHEIHADGGGEMIRWILRCATSSGSSAHVGDFRRRSRAVWGGVLPLPDFPAAGGKIIHHDDASFLRQQAFDQVRADESRATRHEDVLVLASFQGLCDGFGQFLPVLRIGDLFGFDGIGKISPSIKTAGRLWPCNTSRKRAWRTPRSLWPLTCSNAVCSRIA
jgi:hypothetical protein